MLTKLSAAIEAQLQGLGVFNKVERAISSRLLSNPPTAVYRLVADEPHADDVDQAAGQRRMLTYEILIIGSALAMDQGQAVLDVCIDAVRDGFQGWLAVPAGGCLPVYMGPIALVDEVSNLLVYAGQLQLVVYPDTINRI